MPINSPHRNRILAALFLSFLLVSAPRPAHAASKEIIELQTQVQQLLDQVQRLQSTMDARLGVLQHLSEQTADDANRITATVTELQKKLGTQSEGAGAKLDTVSGQIQSLNDSVDELKARILKLDKAVQEMQAQMQAAQQPAQAAPATNPDGSIPAGAAPGTLPNGAASNQAPPMQETFQAGMRDYNAGRFEVAAGEFQDVIHYYPTDDMAAQAYFYLGEIAFHNQRYSDAVKSYNSVLEGFPGSPRAPAAQLRKGLAQLAMKDRKDAGIHELRLLIQRHPQTPEAEKAREKLNAMGVKIAGK
jgi:TolA-binding protein